MINIFLFCFKQKYLKTSSLLGLFKNPSFKSKLTLYPTRITKDKFYYFTLLLHTLVLLAGN